MRPFFTCLLLFLFQTAISQSSAKPYWQQHVQYHLTANVQPQDHSVDGSLHLVYTNHSPDTLTFIWFHLWPNAYANDKTALMKQLKQIRGRSKKLNEVTDYGSITGLDWKVNNASAQTEPHKEYNDVKPVARI